MIERILTALVGVVVFFLVLLAPGGIFFAGVCAVIAVMLYEIYSVLGSGKGLNITGITAAALIAAGMYTNMLVPAVTGAVIIYLFALIFNHTKKSFREVLPHGFVTLFVTMFMSYISLLRIEGGIYDALWVFVIAWLTDTGAYFSGVFLGKHKLVPAISPKKTVEGAIGGVVICVIFCLIYTPIRAYFKGMECAMTDYLFYACLGAVGSVLSQFGDLAASCIKRDMNAKDYGSILPGHGGLMDRFDSVMFVAPFVYYVLKLFSVI